MACDKGTMDSDNPSEPDSTTLERDIPNQFKKADGVLYRSKDGFFYFGIVVEVDIIFKKCLVVFSDTNKTKKWIFSKDLKILATHEADMCYVCKKSQNKTDNKVIMCKCGRGCHQLCHEPKIPTNCHNWKCKICMPTRKRRCKKPAKRTSTAASEDVISDILPISLSQLPYNPDQLTWDAHHRMNQEGHYCYCGGGGNWNRDMVQCRRCRQWFHTRCAPTVSGPVLPGDRFYVFVCSLCNRGKELSRRLAMKWPDVVQLVLYNLTLTHQTKYYDLEDSIMPFLNQHWHDLKLPPSIAKLSVEERRSNVIYALTTCEKRFKCGREIKKRANIWGLRFRGPPKAPLLSLPQRGPIDDNMLKVYCKKNLVELEMKEYKPLQNGFINSSQSSLTRSATRPVDKSDHRIVPPLLINVPKPYSTSSGSSERPRVTATDTTHRAISSTEYHGRGLVKRSTPFPVSDQPKKEKDEERDRKKENKGTTIFRLHAIRKAIRLLKYEFKKKKKIATYTGATPTGSYVHKNSTQSSVELVEDRQKMDLRRKEATAAVTVHPEVKKRPQRNLLEARLNSTESKLYNPQAQAQAEEENKKRLSDSAKVDGGQKRTKIVKVTDARLKPKLVQKTILDVFHNNAPGVKMKLELVPMVTRVDAISGDSKTNSVKSDRGRPDDSDLQVDTTDDDASSRGTLEPFIPTPKDFEGQNNPFRSVAELLNTAAGVASGGAPSSSITLPLPLKTVIPHSDPPRLKKRQLSEKDIIVDRNGQVKRRRRHRRSQASILAAQALAAGSATKTAQITPTKTSKLSAAECGLQGRQLRAREPMKTAEKLASAKSTPIKQSPSKECTPLESSDLETSVKYFFGAASRIASGEKFEVKAKRITSDGRVQCIIDWKSLPT